MPVTNIKLINYSDGQNLAIDKINHNFDEIAEAHGGSVGETGPAGDRGPIGNNGPLGATGNDGPRGTKWFVQSGIPSLPGGGVVYGDYWVNSSDGEINVFGPTGWNDTGYNVASSGNLFNNIDSYFTSGGTGVGVILNQIKPENYKFIVADKSPQSGVINEKLAKFLISTDTLTDPSPILEFMRSDLISEIPGDFAQHPTFTWSSSLPTDNDLKFDVPGGSLNIGASGGFEAKSKFVNVSAGTLIDINYGATSGSGISATGGILMQTTKNFVLDSSNLTISNSGTFRSNVIVNSNPSDGLPSVFIDAKGTGGFRTSRSSVDTFNTISNSVYNVSLETTTDKEFYINTKGKIRTKKTVSGLSYQSYQAPTYSASGLPDYPNFIDWYFVSNPEGPIQSSVIKNGNNIIITPRDPGSSRAIGIGLYSDPLYSLWGPNGIENGQSIDISIFCSPDDSKLTATLPSSLFKFLGIGTTAGVSFTPYLSIIGPNNPVVSIDFTITKGVTGSNTTIYYKTYPPPDSTYTGKSGYFVV